MPRVPYDRQAAFASLLDEANITAEEIQEIGLEVDKVHLPRRSPGTEKAAQAEADRLKTFLMRGDTGGRTKEVFEKGGRSLTLSKSCGKHPKVFELKSFLQVRARVLVRKLGRPPAVSTLEAVVNSLAAYFTRIKGQALDPEDVSQAFTYLYGDLKTKFNLSTQVRKKETANLEDFVLVVRATWHPAAGFLCPRSRLQFHTFFLFFVLSVSRPEELSLTEAWAEEADGLRYSDLECRLGWSDDLDRPVCDIKVKVRLIKGKRFDEASWKDCLLVEEDDRLSGFDPVLAFLALAFKDQAFQDVTSYDQILHISKEDIKAQGGSLDFKIKESMKDVFVLRERGQKGDFALDGGPASYGTFLSALKRVLTVAGIHPPSGLSQDDIKAAFGHNPSSRVLARRYMSKVIPFDTAGLVLGRPLGVDRRLLHSGLPKGANLPIAPSLKDKRAPRRISDQDETVLRLEQELEILRQNLEAADEAKRGDISQEIRSLSNRISSRNDRLQVKNFRQSNIGRDNEARREVFRRGVRAAQGSKDAPLPICEQLREPRQVVLASSSAVASAVVPDVEAPLDTSYVEEFFAKQGRIFAEVSDASTEPGPVDPFNLPPTFDASISLNEPEPFNPFPAPGPLNPFHAPGPFHPFTTFGASIPLNEPGPFDLFDLPPTFDASIPLIEPRPFDPLGAFAPFGPLDAFAPSAPSNESGAVGLLNPLLTSGNSVPRSTSMGSTFPDPLMPTSYTSATAYASSSRASAANLLAANSAAGLLRDLPWQQPLGPSCAPLMPSFGPQTVTEGFTQGYEDGYEDGYEGGYEDGDEDGDEDTKDDTPSSFREALEMMGGDEGGFPKLLEEGAAEVERSQERYEDRAAETREVLVKQGTRHLPKQQILVDALQDLTRGDPDLPLAACDKFQALRKLLFPADPTAPPDRRETIQAILDERYWDINLPTRYSEGLLPGRRCPVIGCAQVVKTGSNHVTSCIRGQLVERFVTCFLDNVDLDECPFDGCNKGPFKTVASLCKHLIHERSSRCGQVCGARLATGRCEVILDNDTDLASIHLYGHGILPLDNPRIQDNLARIRAQGQGEEDDAGGDHEDTIEVDHAEADGEEGAVEKDKGKESVLEGPAKSRRVLKGPLDQVMHCATCDRWLIGLANLHQHAQGHLDQDLPRLASDPLSCTNPTKGRLSQEDRLILAEAKCPWHLFDEGETPTKRWFSTHLDASNHRNHLGSHLQGILEPTPCPFPSCDPLKLHTSTDLGNHLEEEHGIHLPLLGRKHKLEDFRDVEEGTSLSAARRVKPRTISEVEASRDEEGPERIDLDERGRIEAEARRRQDEESLRVAGLKPVEEMGRRGLLHELRAWGIKVQHSVEPAALRDMARSLSQRMERTGQVPTKFEERRKAWLHAACVSVGVSVGQAKYRNLSPRRLAEALSKWTCKHGPVFLELDPQESSNTARATSVVSSTSAATTSLLTPAPIPAFELPVTIVEDPPFEQDSQAIADQDPEQAHGNKGLRIEEAYQDAMEGDSRSGREVEGSAMGQERMAEDLTALLAGLNEEDSDIPQELFF